MINKRIFGTDIPLEVKKVLEARQFLANKNKQPGDEITSEETKFQDDFDPYEFRDLSNQNFNGVVSDLSSRTPFIRMWIGVEVFKKEPKSGEVGRSSSEMDSQDALPEDYFFAEWSETGGQFGTGDYKWFSQEQIEDTAIGSKIYMVGTNMGNQVPNPNDPIIIEESLTSLALPDEYQTNRNEFFKPSAGIVSVQSDTENMFGSIKTTEVAFQVSNFHDYDKIYSRYFLRPGAQVFVDFGWDTSDLYNPDDLLDGKCPDYDEVEDNRHPGQIEKCLFGEIEKDGFDGYVTDSKGGLETILGTVVDYSSVINADGTVSCTVKLVSKNSSLINHNTLDDEQKIHRMETILETTVLYNALFLKYGLPNFSSKEDGQNIHHNENLSLLRNHAFLANSNKLLMAELQSALLKKLGVVNDTGKATEQQAEREEADIGISFSAGGLTGITHDSIKTGVSVNDMNKAVDIYISLGHFEDLILNPEFGFGKDVSEISSGENFETKFDSSLGFTVYDEKLLERQKHLLSLKNKAETQQPVFVFPEWWGSEDITTIETGDNDTFVDTFLIGRVLYNHEYGFCMADMGVGKPCLNCNEQQYMTDSISGDIDTTLINIQGLDDGTFTANDLCCRQIFGDDVFNGGYSYTPDSYSTLSSSDMGVFSYYYNYNEPDLNFDISFDGYECKYDLLYTEHRNYDTNNIESSYNSRILRRFGRKYKALFKDLYTESDIEDMEIETNSGEMVDDFRQYQFDKKYKRIPIRELFVRADVIKKAFTKPDTSLIQSLKDVLKQINEDSYGVMDLKITSAAGDDSKLAITDINYPSAMAQRKVNKNLHDELFEFSVRSENSIVQSYDVSFSLDSSAIGNMMAIRGMGSGGQIIPLNQMLDETAALEAVNSYDLITGDQGLIDSAIKYHVRYLPDIGEHQYLLNERREKDAVYSDQGFTRVGDMLADSALTSNGGPWSFDQLGTIDNYVKSVSTNRFGQTQSSLYFANDIYKYQNKPNIRDGDSKPFDSASDTPSDEGTGDKYELPSKLYQGKDEIVGDNQFEYADAPKTGDNKPYTDEQKSRMVDNGLMNKKWEQSRGRMISSTIGEWLMGIATQNMFGEMDTLLPMKLSIKIYGISSLNPGDIFRVDYLPERYRDNVYFQIMQVSHTVDATGWSTTLNTQWRIKSDSKLKSNIQKKHTGNFIDPNYLGSDTFDIPERLRMGMTELESLPGNYSFVDATNSGGLGPTAGFRAGDFNQSKLSIDGAFKFVWRRPDLASTVPTDYYAGIIPFLVPTVKLGYVEEVWTNAWQTFDEYNQKRTGPWNETTAEKAWYRPDKYLDYLGGALVSAAEPLGDALYTDKDGTSCQVNDSEGPLYDYLDQKITWDIVERDYGKSLSRPNTIDKVFGPYGDLLQSKNKNTTELGTDYKILSSDDGCKSREGYFHYKYCTEPDDLSQVLIKERFTFEYLNRCRSGDRDHVMRFAHHVKLIPGEQYILLVDGESTDDKPLNYLVVPRRVADVHKEFLFWFLHAWMNQSPSYNKYNYFRSLDHIDVSKWKELVEISGGKNSDYYFVEESSLQSEQKQTQTYAWSKLGDAVNIFDD